MFGYREVDEKEASDRSSYMRNGTNRTASQHHADDAGRAGSAPLCERRNLEVVLSICKQRDKVFSGCSRIKKKIQNILLSTSKSCKPVGFSCVNNI